MASFFRVMSWNVFQLPGTGGDQLARLEPMLGFVARYADLYALDAIVLSELFKEEAYALIRARLVGPGRRFAFMSPRPQGVFGGINDGGVAILSRAPARLAFNGVYRAAMSIDALATKGAVGVELDKGGRRFLLAGTHLQASYGTAPDGSGTDPEAPYRATRTRQMAELMAWVSATRGDRQLILAGDLNVDSSDSGTADDRLEWNNLLARHGLQPAASWLAPTPLRETYQPRLNTLARMTCTGDLRRRCLDHVLVRGGNAGTRRWITYPQTPSAWKPPEWLSLESADGRGGTTRSLSSVIFHDLSDHFPTFMEMTL